MTDNYEEFFSEEQLRFAARQVRESLLASLPSPAECEHEFSEVFYQKMKALVDQEQRRQARRKLLQRVAAILLMFTLGFGTWLTVDAEAREAVFAWVREVYENSIVYRFFGSENPGSLPSYEVELIKGYHEVDVFRDDTLCMATYMNADGGCYVLEYMFMQSSSVTTLDPEGSAPEFVSINGCPGEYIAAAAAGEFNALLWHDSEKGISFSLLGTLERETLLHLAENLKLETCHK